MPMGVDAIVGWRVPIPPADALAGAGEDFVLAVLDFVPELAGVGGLWLCVGEVMSV